MSYARHLPEGETTETGGDVALPCALPFGIFRTVSCIEAAPRHKGADCSNAQIHFRQCMVSLPWIVFADREPSGSYGSQMQAPSNRFQKARRRRCHCGSFRRHRRARAVLYRIYTACLRARKGPGGSRAAPADLRGAANRRLAGYAGLHINVVAPASGAHAVRSEQTDLHPRRWDQRCCSANPSKPPCRGTSDLLAHRFASAGATVPTGSQK